MRRGVSLPELVVALGLVGLVTAVTLPRVLAWLDWIAVQRAATQVTSGLAATRYAAVLRMTRARFTLAPDSLRIDEWNDGWQPRARWPGPASYGVTLTTSNATVVYGPLGLGWGASNTTVKLTRGSHTATITTSRLGRVKRW